MKGPAAFVLIQFVIYFKVNLRNLINHPQKKEYKKTPASLFLRPVFFNNSNIYFAVLEVDSVAEAVEDVAADDDEGDSAEAFTIPVTVQTPSALPSAGGV